METEDFQAATKRLNELVSEILQNFDEGRWPLCGDLRSWLFFQLTSLASTFAGETGVKSIADAAEIFRGGNTSLEEVESRGYTIRESFEVFMAAYHAGAAEAQTSEERFEDVDLQMNIYLWLMEEVKLREITPVWFIHNHFLTLIDAEDPKHDDLELVAETTGQDNELQDFFRELKSLRNAMFRGATYEAAQKYFEKAEEILEREEYLNIRIRFSDDPSTEASKARIAELKGKIPQAKSDWETEWLWYLNTSL